MNEPEDPPVCDGLPVGDVQAVPAKHRHRLPLTVRVEDLGFDMSRIDE